MSWPANATGSARLAIFHSQAEIQAEPMPVYAPVRDAVNARLGGLPKGDASGVGAALLGIVEAAQPPLRVFFGTLPMHVVPPLYAERLKTWEQWAGVAAQADGGGKG